MLLNVIVDDQSVDLKVPSAMLNEARSVFEKMDRDMDAGWQMGREWIEETNREQRCQIVADKLLTALENENQRLALMMAGYLLSRMPGLRTVDIDTSGDMIGTSFSVDPREAHTERTPDEFRSAAGMNKMQAMEQAGQDVSKVFRIGRQYRFSVYDHTAGQWQDSAPISDKQEAQALREQAYKRRFDELTGQVPSR